LNLPQLYPDFTDLLECLVAEKVAFLLVGAFAVAANGVARATSDLDVWVRADAENSARTYRALARFGAPLRAHGVEPTDFASPDAIYQLGLPPTRIDILTRIDGVTFDEAWPERIEAEIGGIPLSFLGLRALIRNKRASGRTKDLQDLEFLREAGVPVDD
jgi:hypothetical protein